jgi:hypothetical protein
VLSIEGRVFTSSDLTEYPEHRHADVGPLEAADHGEIEVRAFWGRGS